MRRPPIPIAQNPAASPKQTTPSDTQRPARQMAPDRVEQRIVDLRARLHITPDEQVLWDKFAQVMRDNAQHMLQTAVKAQHSASRFVIWETLLRTAHELDASFTRS